MKAMELLREIVANPVPKQTAREQIEKRLGRKLPPIADMHPDEREAVKRLAVEKIKARRK